MTSTASLLQLVISWFHLSLACQLMSCFYITSSHLAIFHLSYGIGSHVTEYCAVIGPTLHSVRQQTAVMEVTRPLPSLAEWGVAM